MTSTQLAIVPRNLQGKKGSELTEGIPTLICVHLIAMHVAPTHHAEATLSVAAPLNAMRTDNPLILLISLIASPGHVCFHSPHINKVNYN